MLEKYNGIRVFWDESSLKTTNHIPIAVPADIVTKFPKVAFEAQMWYEL